MNRYSLAAIALAVSSVSSAFGQTAYFSLQGSFATNADKHDFGFSLSRSVSNTETLKFETFRSSGGTNGAGETITSGGIDSVLAVYDSGNNLRGQNDQKNVGTNDSYLSWDSPIFFPGSDIPLNPSPLVAGTYRLNMYEFGNNATGPWAVDLKGPSDAFQLNSPTATGTSTISSLKFGTTGAGANAAKFLSTNNLTVGGPLTVGQTGTGVLYLQSGTLTANGAVLVKSGGVINPYGGNFALNANMDIDGGSYIRSAGTFTMTTGKVLTVKNGGTFEFGGPDGDFFLLAASTSVVVTGTGSTFRQTDAVTTDGSIFIDNGASMTANSGGKIEAEYLAIFTGSVTIDGSTSQLVANTGTTAAFDQIIGDGTGTGSLTLKNSASGVLTNLTSIAFAAASHGSITVQSDADLTTDSIEAGAGSSNITVTGSGSTITQTGASTLTFTESTSHTSTLNVQSGGTFNTGTGDITVPAGNQIVVSGGTFNANGNVVINGGNFTYSSGQFHLATGKSFSLSFIASGAPSAAFNTAYVIENNTTFNVNPFTSLTCTSFFDVGNTTNGTLNVIGNLASFSANSYSNIGFNGATGIMNVKSSGMASFVNGFGVGSAPLVPNVSGTLVIESFGTVTTGGDINVAAENTVNASGVITINGGTLTQSGVKNITVGHATQGVGTINVQTGGILNTGTGILTANKTGTINITGGTLNANGNVAIDGGKLYRTSGAFNLAANKSLTASDSGLVSFTNAYIINGGRTFTFNSGADLVITGAGAYNDVGDTTAGTLVVTGTGSTLTVPATTYLGTNGGTGTVTISDNATASYTGGFEVAQSNIANTNGTLNILSGATVTSGHNIRIGADGGTGSSGFVSVNAGTLNQSGARTIVIGHPTTGTGTLSISGSGIVTTGTGPMTINATGTLNNGFGGLFAEDVVNHGSFHSSSISFVHSLAGTGTLTVDGSTFSSDLGIKQNTATVSFGGTIDIAANGGVAGVSVLNNLSFGANGYFNLHDNDLIVDYTSSTNPYTTIRNKVKSGLTLLGGSGNGIGSTEVDAQTVGGTILAVVDSGDPALGGGFTSISGFTVANPGSSVLVKYTWFGDCNLDGVVSGSDYALIDTGFTSGGSLTGWVFGDVDYNGFVQAGDYALADTGFIAQTGTLPEPGVLGLIGLGAFSLMGRRLRVGKSS